MKAFVPSDIFVGLPERGRFATEPVILNFLMMQTTLEILTSKSSAFNDLKISAGSRVVCEGTLFELSRNLKL